MAIETTGIIGARLTSVSEGVGKLGHDSRQFLKELGRRVRRQTGDPSSTSYLLQRLSIQRGNSASVMGSPGSV